LSAYKIKAISASVGVTQMHLSAKESSFRHACMPYFSWSLGTHGPYILDPIRRIRISYSSATAVGQKRESTVMGLELNILPVNPDTAETSPENYFMFCLYSSL